MKKTFAAIAIAAISGTIFTGCTCIESTQKFNAIQLGTQNEKHICQSYVKIPGYFFCGLPIIVGSAKGDGQSTMFRYNLTTENVMYLLTKEVKSKGASRLINVTVSTTEQDVSIFPFLSYKTIQASGTGVGSRRAAIRQAENAYDAR